MSSWINSVCVCLALALIGSTTAVAQTAHDYWWRPQSDDHGSYMHFVDAASIAQTEGERRRFWETSFYQTPWTLRLSGEVRSMVSLGEVNCATSEFRNLALIAYDRRGSVTIHSNDVSAWNFAPPHTRMAETLSLVCTGEPPSEVWSRLGNINPLRIGEDAYD